MNMLGWCMLQTMHWLARIAVLRIRARVARIAIVRVHDVAGGAARGAIVASLIVAAQEPGERIVQARLVDVEHGNGDARTGAGAAIGLLEIRPAGLLQA